MGSETVSARRRSASDRRCEIELDRAESGERDGVAGRERKRLLDGRDERDRAVLVDVQADQDVRGVARLADEAVVEGLGIASHARDPIDAEGRRERRLDRGLELGGRRVGAGLRRSEEGHECRPSAAVVGLEPVRDLGGFRGWVEPAAARQVGRRAPRERAEAGGDDECERNEPASAAIDEPAPACEHPVSPPGSRRPAGPRCPSGRSRSGSSPWRPRRSCGTFRGRCPGRRRRP